MRSSMVLITSGKPRRKSAASCLAASACPAAKSSSAASRLPVWFQSSSCSLRTTALFSSTDTFVSSRSASPYEPCNTIHDATRRDSAHPYALPREACEEAETGSAASLAEWVALRSGSLTVGGGTSGRGLRCAGDAQAEAVVASSTPSAINQLISAPYSGA